MDKNNIVKEYTNGEITIVWRSGKCVHSGKCAGNLPQVFKPAEQPWIQFGNATNEEIIAVVKKCPTGAISIKE